MKVIHCFHGCNHSDTNWTMNIDHVTCLKCLNLMRKESEDKFKYHTKQAAAHKQGWERSKLLIDLAMAKRGMINA